MENIILPLIYCKCISISSIIYAIYTNIFSTGDGRKFTWNFKLEISAFDPEKCVLTKELLPINIRSTHHVTQPIWVQNITLTHLAFTFSARERNLRFHNSNLTVPRQSVWPLLVEYRPVDYNNEVGTNSMACSSPYLSDLPDRGVAEL